MGEMDWQVGDLALCIKSGLQTRSGTLYTVREVFPAGTFIRRGDTDGVHYHFCADCVYLVFEGLIHNKSLCDCRRFIKITPPEADEYDQEIIHLMTTTPHTEEA